MRPTVRATAWRWLLLPLVVAPASCMKGAPAERVPPPSAPAAGTRIDALWDGRLPPGAILRVELTGEIDTEEDRGQPFTASLVESLVDLRGEKLVPAGTLVHGRVEEVPDAHGGSGEVTLRVESMELAGRVIPLIARVVQTEVPESEHRKAKGALAGGATGALVGLVFGNPRAAVMSGAVGAGAGFLIAAGRKLPRSLPPGTRLSVVLDRPVATLSSIRGAPTY